MKLKQIIIILILGAVNLLPNSIKIKILDLETQKTVPARVLIKGADGESYIPEEAVTLTIGNETWFMSTGNSKLKVNSNKITIRVERGKEYIRVKRTVELTGEDVEEIEIVLKRWINMNERGYMSGENHIHRTSEDVAAMSVAEDLNYGTSLQWWNHPRFGVSDGDSHILDLKFGKVTTPVSVYDVEVEEAWGALYIINMPNPFPFINDKKMPNLIAAKYGRERGTLNCYQAGWSREVLVDALLGLVDVVNICNNNFHMHRYQPRSNYSNLLNVDGLPVYSNTAEGMMKMNTDTYYRLLNCGLKIAAGAGSATGAKETPVGFNRSYVRSNKEDGLEKYLNNWKEGKNFVTNGPMIFLRTAEGLRPGDINDFDNRKNITLDVEVISDAPLGSVEIVSNGEVIKSFSLKKGSKEFRGSVEVNINKSSWICARCTDTDNHLDNTELEKYRGPRKKLFQDPNRLRYAHTSPIYYYLNGKEVVVKKSVEEGLKMIDAFEIFAQENSSKEYLETIVTAVKKARQILKNKLK